LVVLIVGSVVWWSVRPAVAPIISAPTFSRWRVLWYITTLAWFLATSFWIYVLVMAVVLLVAGRKESHVFGLYLLLLLAAPPATARIPGFGILDHFFALDHYRLLALALLLPSALRLAMSASTTRFFKSPVDWMVFGYLVLNTLLAFRGDSFTNNARFALMFWVDLFLPYYVASRSIRDTTGFRHALVGLAIGAMLISAFAVVEVLRSWKLFESATVALGLDRYGAYKMRGGMIRPSVTVMDSILLGYVIVVAAGGYLYLRGAIKSPFMRMLGWLALVTGLLASLSRGPWVGAMLLLFVFMLVSPRPFKSLIQALAVATCALVVLSALPAGQKILNLLPFLGQEEQGNVQYRAELLPVSMPVVKRNLLLGAEDFLESPELQVMRQGEGIIDIVNSYLVVTLHTGLVGLFFFVGISLTALMGIRRGMRWARLATDADASQLGRALFSALASIMFIIVTVSGIYIVPILHFAVVGIACAYFLSQRIKATVNRESLAA
jgi:hypothetical protein